MSILTGPEIERQLKLGEIEINPFDRNQLNPNSYDIRLGGKLVAYRAAMEPLQVMRMETGIVCDLRPPTSESLMSKNYLDAAKDNPVVDIEIPETGVVLFPGILYLGASVERIGSDRFMSMIEGKSSLGRLGLTSHITAGLIDTGYFGNLTLEITVIHPLRIYKGMRIGQLCFQEVCGESQLYNGKYQGDNRAQASKAWHDFL